MPNRILRDWTSSETMDALSPGAEVLFTRLIMKADDFGNYTANVKLVKAALFPLKDYSEGQIASWINECAQAGIIKIYVDSGKSYMHIVNFGQRLRAMKGQFPAYCQSNDGHMSVNVQSNDVNCRPETKRREDEVEEETEVEGELKTDAGKPATIDDRRNEFMTKVANAGQEKNFEKKMLREFFDYWTEMNPGGRKMRFEMQKVFDVGRRLTTWYNRSLERKGNGATNNRATPADLAQDFVQRIAERRANGHV